MVRPLPIPYGYPVRDTPDASTKSTPSKKNSVSPTHMDGAPQR